MSKQKNVVLQQNIDLARNLVKECMPKCINAS